MLAGVRAEHPPVSGMLQPPPDRLTAGGSRHANHDGHGGGGSTGFFGQNFAWLVRHISSDTAFLVYGLGGLAVPLALLFWWLRRRTVHTAESS